MQGREKAVGGEHQVIDIAGIDAFVVKGQQRFFQTMQVTHHRSDHALKGHIIAYGVQRALFGIQKEGFHAGEKQLVLVLEIIIQRAATDVQRILKIGDTHVLVTLQRVELHRFADDILASVFHRGRLRVSGAYVDSYCFSASLIIRLPSAMISSALSKSKVL